VLQYLPHLLAALPPSAELAVAAVLLVGLLFIGPSGVVDALRRWGARLLRWADGVERLQRIRPWLKGTCVRLLLALAALLQRSANSDDGGDPPQLGPADDDPHAS
jgi:hypothetical protein